MTQSYKKESWRKRIKKGRISFDVNKRVEEEKIPHQNEVGIKHSENGSSIKIDDTGVMRLFVGGGTGIRINPNTDTISFFANNIAFDSDSVNFHTEDDGLIWNYTPLNRELANPKTEVMTANIGGTDLLRSTLTSGCYICPKCGAPVIPGKIKKINYINMTGIREYKGIEHVNMMKRIGEGIQKTFKDIAGDMSGF